MRALLTGFATAALMSTPALAREAFFGVYAHDLDIAALGDFEDGAQLSAGYRTDGIDALAAIGRPSAFVFGAANTSGGVNYAATGLSWRFGDRFYVQPGVGVAVHDGETGEFQVGDELNLGSRVLAELELGVGWRINEASRIELSWVHLSHGQSRGKQNPGLDDVGLRYYRRF